VRNRLSPTLIGLFTVLVLALGLVAPAIAADPDAPRSQLIRTSAGGGHPEPLPPSPSITVRSR